MYLSLGAALGVLAVSMTLLGISGSALPPPKFEIGNEGLLQPSKYPVWQQASDWIADRRYVVLTFDDGPYGHGVDEQILATLKKHNVHAIFFEVCAHVNSDTINVPMRILASGSILGNHSFSHLHLPRLHEGGLRRQIDDCEKRLEAVTGIRPTYFRPPWGQTSPAVLKAVRAAGMQQVLWNANSGDTWLKDPKKIEKLSLREVSLSRASILLMHSRPTTVFALDGLLNELKKRGVRLILPVHSTSSGSSDRSHH